MRSASGSANWAAEISTTVWPSGLRRWLKAPFRKGVGSNPTAVTCALACALQWPVLLVRRGLGLRARGGRRFCMRRARPSERKRANHKRAKRKEEKRPAGCKGQECTLSQNGYGESLSGARPGGFRVQVIVGVDAHLEQRGFAKRVVCGAKEEGSICCRVAGVRRSRKGLQVARAKSVP